MFIQFTIHMFIMCLFKISSLESCACRASSMPSANLTLNCAPHPSCAGRWELNHPWRPALLLPNSRRCRRCKPANQPAATSPRRAGWAQSYALPRRAAAIIQPAPARRDNPAEIKSGEVHRDDTQRFAFGHCGPGRDKA